MIKPIQEKKISETLANYVFNLDLNEVSKEVVEKVKFCILDTVAVGIKGSRSQEASIVEKVIRRNGGKEEASIFNSNLKSTPLNAALVNSTMVHSLELDDTDRYTFYHPGASIITSALAIAQTTNCSSKRLIEAIITGYEVSIRIADAANPAHRNKGFHTSGTIGTFGAGVACAKILGLNIEQIINTIGISGTQAAGLFEFSADGSMTKRIHPGKAAWNG